MESKFFCFEKQTSINILLLSVLNSIYFMFVFNVLLISSVIVLIKLILVKFIAYF